MSRLPVRAALANTILLRLLSMGWRLRMDKVSFAHNVQHLELEKLEHLADLAVLKTSDRDFLEALKKEGFQ